MMDRRDVEAIARSVMSVIRELQQKADDRLAAIERRLEDVAHLAAIQPKQGEPGRDGRDAEAVNVDAIVTLAASMIQVPAPKEPESVDINVIVDEVVKLVPIPEVDEEKIVTRVLNQLPPPPRTDEEQIIAKLAEKIPQEDYLVERVLMHLPQPKEIDESQLVTRVLNQLPPVRDGRDAEPVNVDALIDAVVARVPQPKEIDESQIVSKVLEQLPAPRDGRDAEPVNIDAVVDLVVARLPQPKEIDEQKLINKVLNAIPPPIDGRDGKDGASADNAAIIADLQKTIREWVAEIPVPQEVNIADVVARVLAEIPKSEPVEIDKLVEMTLARIPAPREVDYNAIIVRVLNELPPPPRDGVDGKDGTCVGLPEVLDALAPKMPTAEQVAELVAKSIPAPKDGRDGVDAAPVNIDEIVAKVLAQVPKPENGRDADEEAIISRVMSQIRVPVDGKDGRDAEPLDVERLLTLLYDRVDLNALANRAANLLPTPVDGKDGKSVDILEVVSMVNHAVEDAVQKLQPPAVDHDLIIESVLKQIPTPQPGRSVTVDDCRDVIHEAVTRAVSELPRAQDGAPGKDGQQGPPGESVHPDTLQVMIRRALDEEIERIPKPVNGKDGESIHPDTVQLMVARTVAEAVAQIPQPAAGRDAVQIEILPGIDAAKSYPPRTYARHNGGTWMSVRQTTAGESIDLSEWLCVWDSLCKVEVEQLSDFRTIRIKTTQASGDFDVHEFKVPVMLDAGVFKQGYTYERGDVVTRDGSSWVCQVDQTSAVPGMSKDWRMHVRKGEKGDSPKSAQNGNTPKGPISLK